MLLVQGARVHACQNSHDCLGNGRTWGQGPGLGLRLWNGAFIPITMAEPCYLRLSWRGSAIKDERGGAPALQWLALVPKQTRARAQARTQPPQFGRLGALASLRPTSLQPRAPVKRCTSPRLIEAKQTRADRCGDTAAPPQKPKERAQAPAKPRDPQYQPPIARLLRICTMLPGPLCFPLPLQKAVAIARPAHPISLCLPG